MFLHQGVQSISLSHHITVMETFYEFKLTDLTKRISHLNLYCNIFFFYSWTVRVALHDSRFKIIFNLQSGLAAASQFIDCEPY